MLENQNKSDMFGRIWRIKRMNILDE